LRTQEQADPVVRLVPSPHILVTSQFGNQLDATTRGLEVAASWAPARAWRFDGSYTAFHVTPQLAAASHDRSAAREDGNAPRRQWQVRTAFSPGARATLNLSIFHVGPLEQAHLDGYLRADVTAEWRFTSRVSAMAIGQNLLDAAHTESSGVGSLLLVTQVPRSAGVRLRVTFP
jgi:outer membrane receptor protein involved in Fe transport